MNVTRISTKICLLISVKFVTHYWSRGNQCHIQCAPILCVQSVSAVRYPCRLTKITIWSAWHAAICTSCQTHAHKQTCTNNFTDNMAECWWPLSKYIYFALALWCCLFLFIPQFTIPKDATGDFDDNAFALKIMAIDYNATNTLRSRWANSSTNLVYFLYKLILWKAQNQEI